MLSLRLNSELLDLDTDAGMEIVLSCPLFDKDKVARSFSYPFRLPLTDRNRRALRHVNRFDATNPWSTSGCVLEVSGGQFEAGELVTLGSDPDRLEVQFRNVPVTVLEDLQRLNVHEILETLIVPDTTDDAAIILTITSPPFAYQIRIGGIDYTLGIGGSSGMTTSDVGVYFRDLINADYPGMASSNTTQLILDSALINDNPALWTTMTGFSIASYITVGQKAQNDFVAYVEAVIATPVDEIVWPIYEWSGLYAGKNSLYEGTANPVFAGAGLKNAPNDDESKWQYTYIPGVRLPYILERIRAAAGIGYLAGYVTDNADFLAAFEVSNLTCDKSYKDYYDDETYKFLNGFGYSIDLNRHVPKMTALEFLKKLCDGLNLIMEYKQGGLHFTKVLDLLTEAPAEWGNFVSDRDYNFTLKEPQGVTMTFPDNDKEGYSAAGQLDDYVVAPGKTRITLPFGTLATNNGFLLDHGTYRCPLTDQPGQSPIFGGHNTDLPLTLLFYRGVKETSEMEDYAYASHDELDTDETTVIGGLSLELDGDYGLVAQNWGASLLFSDLQSLDIRAVLPASALHSLRRWKNARVRFFHPNGAVVLILRSVEFQVRSRLDSGWVPARIRGVVE